MAGVYIKGENIPYGCAVCPCHNWEQGFCQVFDDFRAADDGQTRPDWCPLVLVPDHGDLIDRDALAKDLAYDVEMDEKALDNTDIVGIERTHLQFDKDCKQNCMYYLTEQEAVIPAERDVKVCPLHSDDEVTKYCVEGPCTDEIEGHCPIAERNEE